ncbi:MAG: hypothetical protein AB9M60_06550 [Leptothrix sp. (in: b-proteobacteria)]
MLITQSDALLPADTAATGEAAAGRSCPLHYRYGPAVFDRPAEARTEALYVVGGLYGNEPALASVLALFAREPGVAGASKRLVFNGDFHWFDTDPGAFARIQAAVLAHDALRGNVETELADTAQDDGADDGAGGNAGCGCAYPDWVGDGVVERSNRIHQRLLATARRFPALRAQLAALPMHRRIDVGALRVAIVHGDAQSLAGWGFAQEHLRDAAHRAEVRRWFDAARVDAFACSHTCLPIFHTLRRASAASAASDPGDAGARLVLNNGAAGMPNFRADPAGLLTRIALTPFDGPQRRHGLVWRPAGEPGAAPLHIDAIAVDADPARWQPQFLAQWPAGSDAHQSYWDRIQAGPAYTPAQATLTSED